MIDNIEMLIASFKDWEITLENNKERIIVKGISNNNYDDLFSVIKQISFECNHNLTINLSYNQGIKAVLDIKKKARKYAKMYTSGCFDLFHYGHLNILERSKELCDYLVVGVSTDELIEKEKGRRPVIPYNERSKIVKAIKFVDEVIPQIDKNKQRIVDDYNIDAISVGDDWKGRFPKTTCPIEYFSYTKSISSTLLKDILKLN